MSFGRWVVALVAVAALLAGCDSGDSGSAARAAPAVPAENGVAALAPAEILARAKAALAGAKSFSVRGSMPGEDQKIAVDLRISGADLAGAMTWEQARARVDLLMVGGQRYVRPDERFLAMTSAGSAGAASISKALAGRWARVPAGNKDFAALFGVADVDGLLAVDGTLTKGPVKRIGGTAAVALVEKPGGGVLYVATAGEPYPLRLDSGGSVAFGDFGATFAELKAPGEAEAVDLAQLPR